MRNSYEHLDLIWSCGLVGHPPSQAEAEQWTNWHCLTLTTAVSACHADAELFNVEKQGEIGIHNNTPSIFDQCRVLTKYLLMFEMEDKYICLF